MVRDRESLAQHVFYPTMGDNTLIDDRATYLEQRYASSVALGRDQVAFDAAVEAIVQADRHRYAYLWTWLGVPIIQLPADIIATQEVVWENRPSIIIETGVARGGSAIFLASLLELIGGNGRVIGVDIDIRTHNREAIEAHPMSSRITLIEGPSTALSTLNQIKSMISKEDKVMVILDSDHSYAHVLDELRNFAPLVTSGQYLVVADTLLGLIRPDQTPRERSALWEPGNDPLTALKSFMTETTDFETDQATNGKLVLSSSPGGYLRRK